MDISTAEQGLHETSPGALVDRLCRATNAHDLDAVVACFAPDYRNETPAHPERGFTGVEQVRKNWQQIFAMIPDISAEVLRCAVEGDTAWSEWEHRGTRPDGSRHVMPRRRHLRRRCRCRRLGPLLPRAGRARRRRCRRVQRTPARRQLTARTKPSGSARLTVNWRIRSGNPKQRPRALGSIVMRTRPLLEPLTNHSPRHPCTPHPNTGPATRFTSVSDDLGTRAANAHPPRPIRTETRSSSTRTYECRGPSSIGNISTRMKGL